MSMGFKIGVYVRAGMNTNLKGKKNASPLKVAVAVVFLDIYGKDVVATGIRFHLTVCCCTGPLCV